MTRLTQDEDHADLVVEACIHRTAYNYWKLVDSNSVSNREIVTCDSETRA